MKDEGGRQLVVKPGKHGRPAAATILGVGLTLAACSDPGETGSRPDSIGNPRQVAASAPAEGSGSAQPGQDPSAFLPPGHPPLPAGHPPIAGAGGAGAGAGDGAADIASGMTQGASGLAWQTPPGWRQAPERALRVATFHASPGDAAAEPVECYVAELAGSAGGVKANVDRWYTQMGAEPLSEAELEALETVRILGLDAPVVDVQGAYRGMGGETVPDARLLGAVVPLDGRTLFIKLIGPSAEVASERDAFLALCKSLREES
jgi:hypothetical protein